LQVDCEALAVQAVPDAVAAVVGDLGREQRECFSMSLTSASRPLAPIAFNSACSLLRYVSPSVTL